MCSRHGTGIIGQGTVRNCLRPVVDVIHFEAHADFVYDINFADLT